MKDLAAQLADCYGMLGGNFRRLERTEDAMACFERGLRFEISDALEVMSSYNLVNAIVVPIEGKAADPQSQRQRIQSAVVVISRQVRGERRSDRWAWADLALCHLLLGQRAEALRSYARVRDLGDDGTVKSIVPVLERLRVAVPACAADIAAAIEALSGGSVAMTGASL